jgi:hypothetical protein
MEPAQNLIEGLRQELDRNRELVKIYDSIPTGKFGSVMIGLDIKEAERAIEEGDTVAMIRVYKALCENE